MNAPFDKKKTTCGKFPSHTWIVIKVLEKVIL